MSSGLGSLGGFGILGGDLWCLGMCKAEFLVNFAFELGRLVRYFPNFGWFGVLVLFSACSELYLSGLGFRKFRVVVLGGFSDLVVGLRCLGLV